MVTNNELEQRYKQAAKKLRDCAKLLDERSPTKSEITADIAVDQGAVCQLACDELAVAIIVKELACGPGPA